MAGTSPVSPARRPHRIVDGLAVHRIGGGDPVLLMPAPHRFERVGLAEFDLLVDGLTGLGRQVVTYDPPGSGRSTQPARVTLDEVLECTDRALDACGIGRPVDAVGHSMAGLALLAYALERPRRIRRLVLVGTGSGGPAYMGAPGALWNRTHRGFPGLAALGLLFYAWPRRAPETLLNNYISRRSYVDPRFVTAERVHRQDWARPATGHPEWHRVARRLDYRSRLGEIAVPTLVLCGRFDVQFAPACSEELAAGIPHARLVLFEASNHFPFVEEPEAFWRVVRDFLGPATPTSRAPTR
jgi:pimeloyl-ACP methyl ester carboxylesterase